VDQVKTRWKRRGWKRWRRRRRWRWKRCLSIFATRNLRTMQKKIFLVAGLATVLHDRTISNDNCVETPPLRIRPILPPSRTAVPQFIAHRALH
jgi:hypothetical protein